MNRDKNQTPIGGFFELELPLGKRQFHQNAVALSTGRSCLCAILGYLRPKHCWLPYYICAPAIDPFEKYGVEVEFYEVTEEMTPAEYPELGPDDCLMYVNYFGIKRDEVDRLVVRYGDRLIIDDTHDFFHEGGYDDAWSFTSARKYFGVPDGAFLSVPQGIDCSDVVPAETPAFTDISVEHSLARSFGRQEESFELFTDYEARLPCELHRISEYSQCILSHIDFAHVRDIRLDNFRELAEVLGEFNNLQAVLPDDAVPFAYPFLPNRLIDRQTFFEQQIYVPTLWPILPECDASGFSMSVSLSNHILPLPIDHRYGRNEMKRISGVVTNHGK